MAFVWRSFQEGQPPKPPVVRFARVFVCVCHTSAVASLDPPSRLVASGCSYGNFSWGPALRPPVVGSVALCPRARSDLSRTSFSLVAPGGLGHTKARATRATRGGAGG
jgi:hypothetical protein